MKVCQHCQAENLDSAKFCEQCGKPLEEHVSLNNQPQNELNHQVMPNNNQNQSGQMNSVAPVQSKTNKSNSIMIGIIVGIIIVGGSVIFYMSQGNAAKGKLVETTETSTKENETSKYDDILSKAKSLTLDEKYKESELELNKIPVSELSKSENSAIKEAVESISAENKDGLKKKEDDKERKHSESKKVESDNVKRSSSTKSSGNIGKWAGTYDFYYNINGDQIQDELTIYSDGEVVQDNRNGSTYTGVASISSASGSVLSYTTNAGSPSRMPSTKMIDPNVEITIVWDNDGGTQNYYGYLSYSNRLALTDGSSKSGGVNEVWVKY